MVDTGGELQKTPVKELSYKVLTPVPQDLPPEFRTLGQSENLSPDNVGTIYRENIISKELIVDGIKRPFTPEKQDLPPQWICVSGYLHDLQKTIDRFGEDVGVVYRQWGAKAIGSRIDQGIPEGDRGKYAMKPIVPIWAEGQDDVCEMWLFGLTEQEVEGIRENFLKPVEQNMDLAKGEGEDASRTQTFFEASIGVVSSLDEDPEINKIFDELKGQLQRNERPDSVKLLARIRKRMLLNRLEWEEEVDGRGLFHTPEAIAQRKRIKDILKNDESLKVSFTEAKNLVNQETILHMALDAHHRQRERAQQLTEEKAELAEKAATDSLTGLPNRGSFDERLKQEYSNAARLKNSLNLGIIDVDFFKEINDTKGHATGDLILKKVAEILKQNLRTGDFVGRIGGDEFGVLMPTRTKEDEEVLKAIIERIRKAIQESPEYPQGLRPTVSIGLATFPNGIDSYDELFSKADAALYKAKEEGRNRAMRFEGNNNGQDQFSNVEVSPGS